MYRLHPASVILLALVLCLACTQPVPMNKASLEQHVSAGPSEPEFLFALEKVMLANGFKILERAIDSVGYRFVVTWTVPTARQQFWQRQYVARYNGDVDAHFTDGQWLVAAHFGVYEDQQSKSLLQEFQQFVIEPLQAELAVGEK